MIDVSKILKRSWNILWSYRLLWVFGFILALTMGSLNANTFQYTFGSQDRPMMNNFGSYGGWQGFRGETFTEVVQDVFHQMGIALNQLQRMYPTEFRMATSLLVTVIVLGVLGGIIFAFLRYTAITASIRMVDKYELSGVKVGFRKAWHYGWSSAAWRAFLINLLVNLPLFLLFVTLGLIAWWVVAGIASGVEFDHLHPPHRWRRAGLPAHLRHRDRDGGDVRVAQLCLAGHRPGRCWRVRFAGAELADDVAALEERGHHVAADGRAGHRLDDRLHHPDDPAADALGDHLALRRAGRRRAGADRHRPGISVRRPRFLAVGLWRSGGSAVLLHHRLLPDHPGERLVGDLPVQRVDAGVSRAEGDRGAEGSAGNTVGAGRTGSAGDIGSRTTRGGRAASGYAAGGYTAGDTRRELMTDG